MSWVVVKRNYHGAEKKESPFPWVGVRWVVQEEGQTRGICECWEEEAAEWIAAALNGEEK